MRKKIGYIVLGILALSMLTATFLYFQFIPSKNLQWGITFSTTHAEYLGFDWKTMYIDILNDLKPKKLRLIAYWENLEKEPGLWYFQDIDEMLDEADRRDLEVMLTIGHKVPRWPECHHPAWYNNLTQEQKDQALLNMVEMSVNHYKPHKSIKVWQIENEALFGFGPDCPQTSKTVLKKEMAIVRQADSRPILLSDSGEIGRWVPTARLNPDIFGTTMYRVVYHKTFGYIQYPLPPAFFRIKGGLTRMLSGVEEFKGVELQAEPWFKDDVHTTGLATQNALMNPKIFRQNIEYARKVGLKDNYLWGVEWWYWMAHKQGDWGMWEEARKLFGG